MSDSRDGFIRLHNVRPFVQYLKTRQIEYRPAFHALGLDEAAIADARASTHAELVYGLLNALADVADDPYLGYHVAESFEFWDCPLFYYVASQSGTVGEFLARFLAQIPKETSSTRHILVVEAEHATYQVVRSSLPSNSTGQADAFGAVRFLRLFETIAGSIWNPGNVELFTSHPNELPKTLSGVHVHKHDKSALELRFPNSWLYSPLEFKFSLTRKSRRNVALASTELSLIVALRDAAKPMLVDQHIDANLLAHVLGIETKHMIRALKLQKTTLAKEIKRLRIDLATEQLAKSSAAIRDIGMSLGYTDSTHFTRFFRSQTGLTPREYRKQWSKAAFSRADGA